jgi:hypothetical protein
MEVDLLDNTEEDDNLDLISLFNFMSSSDFCENKEPCEGFISKIETNSSTDSTEPKHKKKKKTIFKRKLEVTTNSLTKPRLSLQNNKNYHLLSKELRDLLRIPRKLFDCILDGDLDQLSFLVEKSFSEHCSMQTEISGKIDGRHMVQGYFQSMCNNLPDRVGILKKEEFDYTNSVLTTVHLCSGTQLFSGGYDYLYDIIKYGNTETMSKKLLELREKASNIVKSGGIYKIYLKLIVRLFVNTDLNKFDKMVVISKLLEVEDVTRVVIRQPHLICAK